MKKPKITILVPVYNEEEGLKEFIHDLEQAFSGIPSYYFNILFINDGSIDGTLPILKNLSSENEHIEYLSLSKNFGKEIALLAGLDHLSPESDAAVLMDADLQHPPEVLHEMIKHWESGVQDVYAVRNNRNYEPILKRILTKVYYKILLVGTSKKINPKAGDFRLLDKKVVKALSSIRETQRYTKGLYDLVGFKKEAINFEVPQRKYGKTRWSLKKLFGLAIDGITSYTTLPLRVATLLGFILSFFAFLYMAYIIVKTILYGDPVAGYPSLISIVLFMGGIQLVCIGILGEYIGKIFYESKQRPLYFIDESSF